MKESKDAKNACWFSSEPARSEKVVAVGVPGSFLVH